MNTNYYFTASILPELQLNNPPEISFSDFIFLLKTNLTNHDYSQVVVMRRYYDIQNMRKFWLGERLDQKGNFTQMELEESILTQVGLTDYMINFLEKYEKLDDRLRFFSELVASYYREEVLEAIGFLKDYLEFEREWRLVLTGFRALVFKKDLNKELQFEDAYDPLTAQILAQKDANIYEPPLRYTDLKPVFEKYKDLPLDLYQALSEYRFNKIATMIGVEDFSIGKILGYMAQLIIVESSFELNKKNGLKVVEEIIK